MRDKLVKKKIKRFDYYQFLIDRKLYVDFILWRNDLNFRRDLHSRYKCMHDFIFSRGLMHELVCNPRYDRKKSPCSVDDVNEPWVRDGDGVLIRRL